MIGTDVDILASEVGKASVAKEPVLKHDDFVRFGAEGEGIGESRFFNCCLLGQDSYKRFLETEYYSVDIQRYADRNKISYSTAYKEVKDFAIKHMEKTLYIKLSTGATWGTPLIYDVEFCETDKYIKIKWNKEVIPLISGEMEPGKFKRYDARMDSVSNNKVYLLSELLQKNIYKLSLKPYSFAISTREIREVTGTTDKYDSYAELSRNVIKPTVKAMYETIGENLDYKGNKHTVNFWRIK